MENLLWEQRVAALRKPDAFPILLAHHPHAFDPAAEAGLPLTLAGHSHGETGPELFKIAADALKELCRRLNVPLAGA